MTTQTEPVAYYWPRRQNTPVRLSDVRLLEPIAGFVSGVTPEGLLFHVHHSRISRTADQKPENLPLPD